MTHCRLFLAISVMLAASFTGMAGSAPELKFTQDAELPNIGLSMELMTHGRAAPLPPPTVYTYTFRGDDGSSWKEEKYGPWDLWYATQHGGRWIDEYTNTLTIARITCPFTHNIRSKHITRARYKDIIKAVYSEPVEWTDAEIRNWAKDFTRCKTVKSERMSANSIKIKDLIKLYIDNDPYKLAYSFRLNPAAAGQRDADTSPYFFMVELNGKADPNKAQKTVHSDFIENLSASSERGSGSVMSSKKFQIKRQSSLADKRRAPERSAEFMESRNTVANSIKNMPSWWYVNTDNYIILANLSLKHKALVKQLQEDIEFLRSAYFELMPPRTEINAVSVIRVFATPQEYVAYVGPEHSWSGGLWMASKKEMAIRPIDWGRNRDQSRNVMETAYHEAFHQYIFYALDQVRTSVWFNEGHAVFFEHSEIKNNRLEIQEHEYSVQRLLTMISQNKASIPELIQMDYKDFYAEDDEKRSANYCLAWALVYYLRKGACFDKPAAHVKLLDRYIDTLWRTKDERKATEEAFGRTNQYNFQDDFIAFWTSRSKRSAARRNKLFKKR